MPPWLDERIKIGNARRREALLEALRHAVKGRKKKDLLADESFVLVRDRMKAQSKGRMAAKTYSREGAEPGRFVTSRHLSLGQGKASPLGDARAYDGQDIRQSLARRGLPRSPDRLMPYYGTYRDAPLRQPKGWRPEARSISRKVEARKRELADAAEERTKTVRAAKAERGKKVVARKRKTWQEPVPTTSGGRLDQPYNDASVRWRP
jgi:hypothetical protein